MNIENSSCFLKNFKEGNEAAFEQTFKANYGRIVGFCQQFIVDKDKSQSLAQEAFIKLWLNKAKIETINGIYAFLYTAAKSECLNYIRHNKIINNYEDIYIQAKERDINREILESFDFDQLELTELESLITKSINDLPEKCRQVFQLSRYEKKMNSEIAQELNISVKSVEAHITRALKLLKVSLSDYLPILLVEMIIQSV